MTTNNTPDPAEESAQAARKARFGVLPDRIPVEEMVEEQPALPPNQAVDSYDPDGAAVRFGCLAADLGL